MGLPADEVPAAGAKAELRAAVRRARAARLARGTAPEDSRALAAAAIASAALSHLREARSGTVAAYVALPGEPDLAPLRRTLREAGVCVVLPVVAGPDTMAWADDTGTLGPGRRLPGGLRLLEPPGPTRSLTDLDLGRHDVLLVPALAVSRDGARLGQGGGFYDRALATVGRYPSGPLVVAVVHDDELLPAGAVPAMAHDRRVDAVLTPSTWLPLGG